jgi:hypothetical protein
MQTFYVLLGYTILGGTVGPHFNCLQPCGNALVLGDGIRSTKMTPPWSKDEVWTAGSQCSYSRSLGMRAFSEY